MFSIYKTDYSVTESSGWIPDSYGSGRILYYNNNRIPLSFLTNVGNSASTIPDSADTISEVCFSRINKENTFFSVDGDINTEVSYSELKKLKDGILWQDSAMYAFTYKVGEISIDFEYKDRPTDNSIADFIYVSNRDWTPEADNWEKEDFKLNTYQSIIDKYYETCYKEHDTECSYCLCALCDIDGNGVEELIIQTGTCEQDRTQYIYTNKDGKSVKLGEYNAWHLALYDDAQGDGKLVGVDGMSMTGNIYNITIMDNALNHEISKSFSDVKEYPSYSNPIEFSEIYTYSSDYSG